MIDSGGQMALPRGCVKLARRYVFFRESKRFQGLGPRCWKAMKKRPRSGLWYRSRDVPIFPKISSIGLDG